MRWGSNNDRWIRPIKNILCVFDKKVIKFKYAGVASNFTLLEIIISMKRRLNLQIFKNIKRIYKKIR